jgi:hypothetical protein
MTAEEFQRIVAADAHLSDPVRRAALAAKPTTQFGPTLIRRLGSGKAFRDTEPQTCPPKPRQPPRHGDTEREHREES